MEGWVDLADLIAPQPGVEPATFRSQVQRRTAAPPPRGAGDSFCYLDHTKNPTDDDDDNDDDECE